MYEIILRLAVLCLQTEIGRMAFTAGLAVGVLVCIGAYLCTKER